MWTPRQETAAQPLFEARRHTRRLTLDLLALADDHDLRTQYHPDFSPIGWHFGHIALFEARWLLEKALGWPPVAAAIQHQFDPAQLEKPARGQWLDRAALLRFADEIHQRASEGLACSQTARLGRDLRAWWMVLAHEQQHAETIATILQMRPAPRREQARGFATATPEPLADLTAPTLLSVPAAVVRLGEDNPLIGWDNERPSFEIRLDAFAIDDRPATNADWLAFIVAGGYARPELWSEAGWAWRVREGVTHPFTWERAATGHRLRGFRGDGVLPGSLPVEGISAFEAEAYARFVGGRLPTEQEWEAAARAFPEATPQIGVRCGGARPTRTGDFIGNVWEWTASSFAPYPGFSPDAYAQYSQPYFDGRHRVLRGGSWATQTRIARPAFRDWYPPHWRAMFTGVRCVRPR